MHIKLLLENENQDVIDYLTNKGLNNEPTSLCIIS